VRLYLVDGDVAVFPVERQLHAKRGVVAAAERAGAEPVEDGDREEAAL
jgi:hypothetical protein